MRPSVVHYHQEPHVIEEHIHDNHVACGPEGVSASAAVDAIARAGSRYGPVHVSSVQGRPVVTLSGPRSHGLAISGPSAPVALVAGPSGHRVVLSGPQVPVAYITGPSGSISAGSSASASASAHAHADAHSHADEWVERKFWYPSPSWRQC